MKYEKTKINITCHDSLTKTHPHSTNTLTHNKIHPQTTKLTQTHNKQTLQNPHTQTLIKKLSNDEIGNSVHVCFYVLVTKIYIQDIHMHKYAYKHKHTQILYTINTGKMNNLAYYCYKLKVRKYLKFFIFEFTFETNTKLRLFSYSLCLMKYSYWHVSQLLVYLLYGAI